MGNVLRNPTTGAAILLTPRTGSHSLVTAAISAWWPDTILNGDEHPAVVIPAQENWDGTAADVAVIVRNSVERFRSICAHRPDATVDEHLDNVTYGPLPAGPFARVFKFEAGLDAVAQYLDLPVPLLHLDATDEADKPQLTTEQESRVREIYATDIALWESLG
jgi:hypothetical protein